MCICSVTTAQPTGYFYGFYFYFIFFFAVCATFLFCLHVTQQRVSLHFTPLFALYLPFCASYKCLGCLSLSLTSHLRRLCLSAGLQVTVPLLLAGKDFIWNARSAEKEWQAKALLLLLPEANAQNKTKQSTAQQQQQRTIAHTRPDRRSEQSRATLQLWLRPTTLMTEGGTHSRTIRRPDDDETSTHSNLR